MARPKRNNTRNSQSKDVASLPLQQDSESEEVVEDNDNEEEEEEEEENNKKKQADNSKKQSSRNDASKPKRRTNQKPRGPGYSSEETDILLTSIQDVLPIGPLDWEKVVQMHTDQFPGMGRDLQSVRRKFNKLQASRVPTGDPNCPPAVRTAKRIHREIEEKMDAEEEVEEQELGFPDNENESTIMPSTNPSANPSTTLFR